MAVDEHDAKDYQAAEGPTHFTAAFTENPQLYITFFWLRFLSSIFRSNILLPQTSDSRTSNNLRVHGIHLST